MRLLRSDVIAACGSVPMKQTMMLWSWWSGSMRVRIVEEVFGFMTYRSEGETEGVSTLIALLML